jgi:hypothetical protein
MFAGCVKLRSPGWPILCPPCWTKGGAFDFDFGFAFDFSLAFVFTTKNLKGYCGKRQAEK